MIVKKFLSLFLFLMLPAVVRGDGQWALQSSTVTYHVSHPLHESEGVSHAARGKGVCQAGQCDFLIAVPVNSFESGDTNRDLHMLQVTRGARYPIVTVRARVPETAAGSTTIRCDLEIQFAGETKRYLDVPIRAVTQGGETRLSATIPATLSDFKIDPPSLLAIPIKNEMPIRVEMTWRPM